MTINARHLGLSAAALLSAFSLAACGSGFSSTTTTSAAGAATTAGSDTEQKITRPKQIYTGYAKRDYVPVDER